MDIMGLLVLLVATVVLYAAGVLNAGSDAPAQTIPHPPHTPDHGGPEGEPGEVAHPHEHGGHEEAPRTHEHVRHDA